MAGQEHNNALPPPPPAAPPTSRSAGNVPGEFYAQQQQHRRRQTAAQPHSITTACVWSQGSSPRSHTHVSGPAESGQSSAGISPYAFSPNTPVPMTPGALHPQSSSLPLSSPMEPYNPRQWTQTRQISGSQMVFGRSGTNASSTREVTGLEEAMPSPPPPYSPETPSGSQYAHRKSPMLDSVGFVASPLPSDSTRNSPQVQMSPAFPPPPSQSSRHRERSASGLSGPRAFLSGLRGKQAVHSEVHAPQPSNTVHVPQFVETHPPAARRAASTGHLPLSQSPAPSRQDRPSLDTRWQPGMPLPGPPPGPPPAEVRSQSLNRYPPTAGSRSNSASSESGFEAQHTRRTAAAAASALGPVPPTPADWVDETSIEAQVQPETNVPKSEPDPDWQPLRIDTGARESGISRRPAKRDSSALRERRSRSRRAREPNGNEVFSPADDDTRPSEQLFSPTSNGSISRRREHMRTISGHAEPSPKATSSSHARSVSSLPSSSAAAMVLTPPYTPAAGKKESDTSKDTGLRVPGSASSDRPISHLLHTPNEDASIPAPLSPARPASSASMKASTRLDAFALQAMERYRNFIEKEATAASDEDRLELFANFIVHESRLRRDRYMSAYRNMAEDIVDLTRDMWRSYTRTGKRAITPSTSISSFDPTIPSWASDGQPGSAQGAVPSSASSLGDYTPATDFGSVGDHAEISERSESRQWAETFKPSLSPIQSVAQSTSQDEDSSRGRAPSRWWEQSNSGSGSIGKPDRIEKSRRETKYMGIRASQLRDTEPSPGLSTTPGASTQTFAQSGGEYPPEKVGWHEANTDFDTPMATPAHPAVTRERKTSTPGIGPLDVSRLVTLPPPYPRHHPAVNNSHPLLGELRSEHRQLTDRTEIQRIKDEYLDQDFAIQQQQKQEAKERRAKLRLSIQAKVADGTVSFAEAAHAEADFDTEESERGKASARANFDLFETQVAQPLNTIVTEKIESATASIGQLRAELSWGAQSSDPNQAQEEGDEQPERLEKLTLLKWLFEAREQLHKEMFDLHAARSEKYSEVILTPYRIQKAQSKIDEATIFFTKDSRDRQQAFVKDSLIRFEDLQQVMEKNVSRGVEDQLSAFWDIAPHLVEVITRVPPDLNDNFDIQIPPQEYEESPAYHEHPMQYLYSLLSHAEKSTYQFIESQTNLLCLLHEVRTATSKINLRLIEIERTAVSPDDPGLQSELARAKEVAERRLDEDLKEKVGEVESQWKEALGDGLGECKARVKGYLEQTGGWEDGLDE